MIHRTGYTSKDVNDYARARIDEVRDEIGPIIKWLKKNGIAADIYWGWTMLIPRDFIDDDSEADEFFADVSTEIEGQSVEGCQIESHAGDGYLDTSDAEDYMADWDGLTAVGVGNGVTPTENQVKELDEIIQDYADLSYVNIFLRDEDGDRYVEISTIDSPKYI